METEPTPAQIRAARRAGIAWQGLTGPEIEEEIARKFGGYRAVLALCAEIDLPIPHNTSMAEVKRLYGERLRELLEESGITEGARVRVRPGTITRHGLATVGPLHLNGTIPVMITLKFDGSRAFTHQAVLVLVCSEAIPHA